MTREEFEALRDRVKASGETLKSVLKAEGIAYSTYNYWLRKTRSAQAPHPIAPITIREPRSEVFESMFAAVGLPGVTLAFPNGLRAHFGQGSETVLMEVLNRSLS